jgi:hypothetical protein
MLIALRLASTQDFEYCKRLYFAGMKKIIEELHLNMAAQAVSFSRAMGVDAGPHHHRRQFRRRLVAEHNAR